MKIVADANIPFVSECFSSIGHVELVEGRNITPLIVADADIILVRSVTPVNRKLLEDSKVQFVATATIGFEHVDVDYLKKCNIGFTSAPGSNANSAAEYVIAALLEIGNRYDIALKGRSIGIIGAGNVGSRVAKKCEALGMKIRLNDPPLQRRTGDVKYRPLKELFDCDFITLHTPLTYDGIDKTYHLADENFFQSLNKGCVFINTSRGAVVDQVALKAAIRSGRSRAVALDVWENEPNIETKLLELIDIGTPHIAGYSLDGKVAGMTMIYKSVCEYFNIEPKFDIEDFLPEPEVKTLEPDWNLDNQQKTLLATVRKIYRIDKDDQRLRGISNVPPKDRGSYFDGLRRDYPTRREFHNTEINVKKADNNLAAKLTGIGFKVRIK